jgi:SAM-dependent methyltransferase
VLRTQTGRVLDVGAGTGGLTRSLIELAPAVVALEPDPRMRAVLARRAPAAHLVAGVGERLPFATGSLDAVVASSSWHWVDPALGWPEVARVLRAGGVFGLFWTGPDRSVPWVAEVLARRQWRAWPARPPGRFGRRMAPPPGLPFGEPEAHVEQFDLAMDEDDLAGLSGTYSAALLAPPAGRAALMASVRARARAVLGGGEAEVPMRCRCWRAIRTSER